MKEQNQEGGRRTSQAFALLLILTLAFTAVFGLFPNSTKAAIFFQDNFDSDTVGALPTGWANIGAATWKVGTAKPVSGANALEDPTFHSGGIAVYTGASAVADSAAQISQVVQLDGSAHGANVGLFLRLSSDGNNGYLFTPDFASNKLLIYRRVSGTYAEIDGSSGIALGRTFANGDVALLKAEASGTTLRFKVWKSTESEPASWTGSIADSSVLTGYVGVYEGYNGGGRGSTVSVFDDVYWWGTVMTSSTATVPTANWNITNNGSGQVVDLTGTYTPGSINGTPTVTTGPNGNGAALAFTASSNIDLGHNFSFGTSDFTIATWLKTSAAPVLVPIGENSGSGNNIWCGIFTGPYATCSAHGSGATPYTLSATTGYNDDTWHLFAIIRRGTGLYLSLDGSDITAATISAGETFAPSGNLFVNQFGSGTGSQFSGVVSVYEVGVWNGTGLSASEMASKYANPGLFWSNNLTAGTISLTSKNSTSVNLSSTATNGGTSPYAYQWYRSTSNGFIPGPSNILSGQTSLTLNDTGLTASTTYYYVVVTTDNTSATANSTQFSVTTSALATNYTFTGPTSGILNTASTFTITPNGEYTGTMTPSSTGSGAFSPTSLTWNHSSAAQTFTYTPTSTTGSPHTISVSSSPSITNSSGTIGYTVTKGTITIAVNDTNWASGRSPYNWYVSGSSYMLAINPGAYFKIGFTGTSVAINVDSSTLSGTAKQYPRIRWSIDGGATTDYQVVTGDTKIPLATGLASGTHNLTLWFLSSDAYIARWGGANALKITGLVIDSDSATVAPTLLPKRMLMFGDSITEGAWSLGNHSDLTNYSTYSESNTAYGPGVAADMNAEYGQAAFGGQAWSSAFNGDVPAFTSAWNYYFNSYSRLTGGLLNPAPDYLLINMGTNGGVSSGAVVNNWLTAARAATGVNSNIFVIVPFNGTARANITSGVNSYKTSSGDTKVSLIDLGADGATYADTVPTYSYDGLHPNLAGHAQLRTLLTNAIRAALSYVITSSADSNGSIAPNGTISANYGSNQSFTIAPAIHYHIADVAVDGSSVGAVSSYQFSNVTADHAISATFAIDTRTLTYTTGAHGTISGPSPQTVNYGANGATVTAVADFGYHFTGWSDGVLTAQRTDANVTDNISVTANFAATTTYGALTSSGGGGMPAGWLNVPDAPSGRFKITANKGVNTTTNRVVTLNFNAGPDVKKIAISLIGDFTDASQENYSSTKQFDLCSKLGGLIKNPTCSDGKYTVYVKFYTQYGVASDVATTTINLQKPNSPISDPFTKYLWYKQTDPDVKRLQMFLNSDLDTKIADSDVGSPGKETNFFGTLTEKAVIKFQEKYAQDVLAPWGFQKGTGVVGKTTLNKINALISK